MWTEILLVSLWGGVVATDTTAVLQIMISRPMVACSVIGLILGNFQLGFTIGVILELLYISELPVGGAHFAESNVGSVAAAAIAVLTARQVPDRVDLIIVSVLLLAVFISWLGGWLVILMRHINSMVYCSILDKKLVTPMHINAGQLIGIMLAFLLGFLSIFASCAVFVWLLPILLLYVPTNLDTMLRPVMGGLLAVGCVYLVHIFWTQDKRKWLLLLGIIIGSVLVFLGI